jgi:ABC-type xylose transport system substrate-binding protein
VQERSDYVHHALNSIIIAGGSTILALSTIFKDTRDLAKVTADMVDAALSGKQVSINDTKTATSLGMIGRSAFRKSPLIAPVDTHLQS